MAFWCRIKQSQLKNLSNHFKRCYFQIHGPCLLNHTASNTRNSVLDNPGGLYHRSQFDICYNVRFFAAPVQAKPKQEVKETSGPRLNEKITAQVVRLVTDEGHDVLPLNEALERAKILKLDLVEVDRISKPPVCKILDYNKEQYNRRLIEKERTKGKSELSLKKGAIKEVRFAFKIAGKDLQMKAESAIKLMEKGYRVKCMALGSEEQDIGELLSRVCALIEDVCIVESGPAVEKKQAYVVVRHAKFGPTKKGLKASKIVVPPRAIEPEGNNDVLPKVDERTEKSTRSIADEADNFNDVFNFGNELPPVQNLTKVPPVSENRYKKSPQTNQMNVNNPNARGDSMRSGPGLGVFGSRESNNNNIPPSGPAVVNRYKKVVPNPPPPGSNFQGNRRPDVGRYGEVHSDNSPATPNRYAENRAGGFRSDKSTVTPNRYAENRAGGFHPDNSTVTPNRYAENQAGGFRSDNRYAENRAGGFRPDNSTVTPNRYAASRTGGVHSDNSTVTPNRYAERRANVRR